MRKGRRYPSYLHKFAPNHVTKGGGAVGATLSHDTSELHPAAKEASKAACGRRNQDRIRPRGRTGSARSPISSAVRTSVIPVLPRKVKPWVCAEASGSTRAERTARKKPRPACDRVPPV